MTPIEWKRLLGCVDEVTEAQGRQSLVSPIDWKHAYKKSCQVLITRLPLIGDAY